MRYKFKCIPIKYLYSKQYLRRNTQVLLSLNFVLLLITQACSVAIKANNDEVIPSAGDYVVSLKENIPELNRMAQESNPDAYLVSVSIPIGPKEQRPYLLGVDYAFVSDSLTLGLIKATDQTIVSEYYSGNHGTLSVAINEDDWMLDSLEIFGIAYSYFAQDYTTNESGYLCGKMGLARNPNLAGNPVVWRVYFDICSSPLRHALGNVILDPITGKEIEIHKELYSP